MSKSSTGSKFIAMIVVVLIGTAAGVGYFKQSAVLSSESEAKSAPPIQKGALKSQTGDIVVGDANAPVTIVEYMSMSCTHCAHFHQEVFPALEKEFLIPGKAKLIVRHFPLNEPAMRGAQIVECAGQNGLDRANFVKVLLDMQSKWAFSEDFIKNLKQIASVGGLDSAAASSCLADKSLETSIIASRKEGEEKLKVDSTPAFFINGVAYSGDRTISGFKKAIESATNAQ